MNQKINDRLRERAVTELLKAKSLDQAARKIGVVGKTLARWLEEDSEFRDMYLKAKREILRRGIANLTSKMFLAGETLGEVSRHKGRPYQGPRAKAAEAIIRLSIDADAFDDLEARIRQLETQRSDD